VRATSLGKERNEAVSRSWRRTQSNCRTQYFRAEQSNWP